MGRERADLAASASRGFGAMIRSETRGITMAY